MTVRWPSCSPGYGLRTSPWSHALFFLHPLSPMLSSAPCRPAPAQLWKGGWGKATRTIQPLSSIPTGPNSAAGLGVTPRTNWALCGCVGQAPEVPYLGLSKSQACRRDWMGVGQDVRCLFQLYNSLSMWDGKAGLELTLQINFCSCSFLNTTPVVPNFSPPCFSGEDKRSGLLPQTLKSTGKSRPW